MKERALIGYALEDAKQLLQKLRAFQSTTDCIAEEELLLQHIKATGEICRVLGRLSKEQST